MSIGTNPRLR